MVVGMARNLCKEAYASKCNGCIHNVKDRLSKLTMYGACGAAAWRHLCCRRRHVLALFRPGEVCGNNDYYCKWKDMY